MADGPPQVDLYCEDRGHELFVRALVLADPTTFEKVVGVSPLADPGKCDRRFYKNHLRQSLARGDQTILTDEMEFAPDLVEAMDLYRAGKNQRSLRLFIEDLNKGLRTLAG